MVVSGQGPYGCYEGRYPNVRVKAAGGQCGGTLSNNIVLPQKPEQKIINVQLKCGLPVSCHSSSLSTKTCVFSCATLNDLHTERENTFTIHDKLKCCHPLTFSLWLLIMQV